ncbi:MAG: segregation/condensation protein A [Peptococcia bacterium]
MPYEVKIPVYEGPMDLLLQLIDDNEVDIYDIPIALITQQYLDYLNLAEEMDLELTSEFVLMACTLLSIKAKMLLPKPPKIEEEEDEIDPRQELVDKLLEYKLFKEKAEVFKSMETKQAMVFTREVDEVKLLQEFPPDNPLGTITLQDLLQAYNQVMVRLAKRNEVISISRTEITVKDRISQIFSQLREKPDGLSFNTLLSESVTKGEVIITFLALLEMCRMGTIILRQAKLFGDIEIYCHPMLEQQEGGQGHVHSIS